MQNGTGPSENSGRSGVYMLNWRADLAHLVGWKMLVREYLFYQSQIWWCTILSHMRLVVEVFQFF